MGTYYDRYSEFKRNGVVKPVPGIVMSVKDTDKQVLYKLGETRLDKLSQVYYGNAYHGWLIMLANPQFGGLEFNIPDRTVIRIPYPFKNSLEQYDNAVLKHKTLYGE